MSEGAWEKKIIWECGFERRTINIKYIDWHSSRGGEEELEILQHKIDFGDELLLHLEPIDPSTAPDYAFFPEGTFRKRKETICLTYVWSMAAFFLFRRRFATFFLGSTSVKLSF